MELLLLRHGEAIDAPTGVSDGERWLTPKGRTVTRAVGHWVATHAAPDWMVVSPLVRATQTAEIVAAETRTERVTVLRALATGDVDALEAFARTHVDTPRLMMVGHEPTLSVLVARLLKTETYGTDKSGLWALHLGAAKGAFSLAWYLRPEPLEKLARPAHLLHG